MSRVPKRAKLEKDPREQNEAILALLGPSEPEPMKRRHVQVHGPGSFNQISPIISSAASFGGQPCTSRAEVAGLPFESLADASRDWYSGGQRNLDTGAGEVDMQADSTSPMDEDKDEVEPPLGVLSNPTFDTEFSCQPHPYGHSLSAQQDEPIAEGSGAVFAADSAMEDVEMEGSQAAASMTVDGPPPPFSWVPPSVSGTFDTLFPSVPSAQMAAFGNSPMGVIEPPMVTDPCVVDMTLSQGITSQQVVPPQALPFVSERTHPSPSVGVELPKEAEPFFPRLSPTLFLSLSPDHTTSLPDATPIAASGSGAVSISANAMEINYSNPTPLSLIDHNEDEAEESKYKPKDSNSYVIYAPGSILLLFTCKVLLQGGFAWNS